MIHSSPERAPRHRTRSRIIRTAPSPFAINVTRGVVLARRLAHAGADRRRNELARREELATGEGLFVALLRWIHTFGLTSSIDAAFLDPEGRVLAAYHDLPPDRISLPAFRARGVLKLPAGTLRNSGTRVGDLVEFLGH